MKQFRKRTIALVLASVVTVAGAFGAENYKNSLMALNFESAGNGAVNMVVQTKTAYDGNINPIRSGANTYILMLPEINSKAPTPNLQKAGGFIESVNIRTMPYSSNGKGYTKITIKTTGAANLSARSQIYVPSEHQERNFIETHETPATYDRNGYENNPTKDLNNRSEHTTYTPPKENAEHSTPRRQDNYYTPPEPEKKVVKTKPAPQKIKPEFKHNNNLGVDTLDNPTPEQKSSFEAFLLVCGIFLILIVSAFCYVKAKNKLRELSGEKLEIDISESEENPKKNETKVKKIKNTIKSLDSAYPKPSAANEYTMPAAPVKTVKVSEELEIVDLDKLFQEKSNASAEQITNETDDDENEALEDFLSGFSFDDSEEEQTPEEEETFDEELYKKTINDNNLKFSKDDRACINKLLSTEIQDSTLKNIGEYAESIPVEHKPSKKQILEDFITTYTVSQNITFAKEDVEALYKLISVEIDSDFVTDLRTNPERTKEMHEEIANFGDKPRKPAEIQTLKVRDLLPDLSEALRQQGGREIESEAKAEVVYYSEGYEVSKLSLDDTLPDLTAELQNQKAYKGKASAEIQYAENSWQVDKLNISTELPDLRDVMAHPDKYNEPAPKKVKADANELLKNIANVTFKPFDDGSRKFEVINDPKDMEAPSVSDIEKEFSQFENFEITQEEIPEAPANDNYDDFESLYSNEFVDLDKKGDNAPAEAGEFATPEPRERTNAAKELMEKIKEKKSELKEKQTQTTEEPQVAESKPEPVMQEASKTEIKCILEGETYTVLDSSEIAPNIGCHLAKNSSGYVILGYIGEKLFKVKIYEDLKTAKIHTRLSEKLENGDLRYIVKVGTHKIIINVSDNNIEYVMDLC